MTSDAPEAKERNSLLAELGRRRVLQAALIYAAVAWSITEVVAFLLDAIPVFPAWSKSLVAILFVVGFPVAMFLAWRFDIGPGGIERTQAATTQGRLTIASAILLLLAATGGIFYLVYPTLVEREAARDLGERPPLFEAPAPDTIAVLPFDLVGDDPEYAYLSSGLSDELRDRLSRVTGLKVAARSSSVVVKNAGLDARSMAARLGAAKLVEGSLSRQPQGLRVAVEIVDGASGSRDWHRNFTVAEGELLEMQSEIGKQIIDQIAPRLNDAFAETRTATLETSANELMLIARHYYQQVRDNPVVDLELLMKSIDLYRQATQIDPDSALAHSRLGAALLYLGDAEAAEGPIFRAYALDPDSSEVQYTLGLFYWRQHLAGSRQAYKRAIELNPNNVEALMAYGQTLWSQNGDSNSAVPYFRRALELDPMSLTLYLEIGNFYGISGWRDDALATADRIEERFDDPRAFLAIARIHELIGDLDVAIAWANRARLADPDFDDAVWMLAELYTRIGDIEAARYFVPEPGFASLYFSRSYEAFIDLVEDLVLENPNQVQLWYGLARAYAATGAYDQAVYVLERQGLPDNVLAESRRTNGTEALANYTDALKHSGQADRARELALWLQAHYLSGLNNGMRNSWWSNLYLACTLSILDDDDRALETLENVTRNTGLVWYPVLRDQPCFRKFVDEPRYQAVVDWVENRKAELRERLPDTLARFQSL
ncbi:MAG: tetratricopeptide repeat protein [Woeseiaceae bacterium]|nr:tetratricopeptide repeat protein [Woeseiaceae bacterium]